MTPKNSFNYDFFAKDQSKIRQYALRLSYDDIELSEDLVHDALIKLLKYDTKFNDQTHQRSLFCLCMKQLSIDYHRKRKETTSLGEAVNIACLDSYTPNHELHIYIKKLKPNLASVVCMRLKGYSYAEISKKLKINQSTARGYYCSSVRELQAIFKREGIDAI